ncbi:MAG: hypothetical protein OXK77_05080 [Gemmatimonadota bacterium]|nr:hypothetical protein [Gemmatimonadota bacterium]MDE2865752.1 hypothetical protein [Gemmatimonadota bacterium]
MPSWFKRYLLPGLVFQSIIIAGGYGTGRELIEFFLEYGVVGGLLGMIPATILVSITCMVGFEFARAYASYDYRSYFKHLLGRGWFTYEIGYLTAVMLVLAVIGSAAGTFLEETFELPGSVGAVALLVAIGVLVFKGTATIERFFAGWSFLLYGAYLVLFVWSMARFGDQISAGIADGEALTGWFSSGVRYAALLVALVPAMLFATRHIDRRREALWAGALAGPISMIPALLFFLALAGQYPGVLDRPVPANHMLEVLGSRPFQIIFQLILFGTLIETGAGLIHAFNERIDGVYRARGSSMPSRWRPLIALFLLATGYAMSRIGLVDLIGMGYNAMSFVFMGVVVVPLLTVGVYKLRGRATAERDRPTAAEAP